MDTLSYTPSCYAGMPNNSSHPKAALHLFFTLRDRPQQQYQEELIPPASQAALSPVARWVCALGDAENCASMADGPAGSAAVVLPQTARLYCACDK